MIVGRYWNGPKDMYWTAGGIFYSGVAGMSVDHGNKSGTSVFKCYELEACENSYLNHRSDLEC